MAGKDRLYGVSELAREFDLTPQALRFYEEKGLLKPQRAGGSRVYDYRDRARLLLILRYRRLGFSLDEIGQYLSTYRSGDANVAQLRLGLEGLRQRRAALERMRGEIAETLAEIAELEQASLARLAELGEPEG